MRSRKKQSKKGLLYSLVVLTLVVFGGIIFYLAQQMPSKTEIANQSQQVLSTQKIAYAVSNDEKAYLKKRFDDLSAVNKDTIGYVYIPGTKLDEPIVQTTDNATYLSKTFEGGTDALLGAVYMDTDNNKQFSDKLTWLFGHARGSRVPDHRMFKTVNYYDTQSYFDKHPYVVVETPTRKYYYEAVFLIIVPENTAFYKTQFENDKEFVEQLTEVKKQATSKNDTISIKATDRYLVLSTCREDDDTIRSNLYLRQIPDEELTAFLDKHGEKLVYQSTR